MLAVLTLKIKFSNIFADNMMKLSVNKSKAIVDFNIQLGELIQCKAEF